MTKNGMIGLLLIVVIVLVAAFLMRGPGQPSRSGVVAPADTPPPVTTPSPPAITPNR